MTKPIPDYHFANYDHDEDGNIVYVMTNGTRITVDQMNSMDSIVVEFYGTNEWRRFGRYHREDGPALIHDDGREEWFLNGVELTDIPQWIVDSGMPHWSEWTDEDRMHFKLRWG